MPSVAHAPAQWRTDTATGRPPRSPQVIRQPRAGRANLEVDWSPWRLTDEDDMGQSPQHDAIIRRFVAILEQWAQERGWARRHIGSDAFFGWVAAEPLVRVSPDVYVVDDPPQPLPDSFQTWLPGHRPPRFALEVVSDDWQKDYREVPQKYAQLGTAELAIFDSVALEPKHAKHRVALQVFRRGADGAFVQVEGGAGPVWSEQLGCWMAVRRDNGVWLRLARDEAGTQLVPTPSEQAEGLAAEVARLQKLLAEKA